MTQMRRLVIGWLGCLGVLVALPVAGQASCPATVILALSRAAAVCQDMGRNTACYGNGSVSATFAGDLTGLALALPGDQVTTQGLLSVRTDSALEWSVARIDTQANLPETEQRSITILLNGNASVENVVPMIPQVSATARGTLNVRALPQQNAEILDRVSIGGLVMASGRTDDGSWLRVAIPNTDVTGWVSRELVESDDNLNTLDVVDADTPLRRPFESIIMDTAAGDAACAGAPESAVLLQTPAGEDNAQITVNGAALHLLGTAWLQIQRSGDAATLTLAVLDGFAVIEAFDATQVVPAGAQTQIPLDDNRLVSGAPSAALPYDSATVATAPVVTLPERIRIAEPLSDDQITAAIADFTMPAIMTTATPAPARCRYTARFAADVRTGPGEQFEQTDVIEQGQAVFPIGRTTDDAGIEWIQLRYRGWVRASVIEASDTCDPLPVAEFVALPGSNTLSLETCTPSNGPLRPGQRVTVEFIPPPRDTFEESMVITRVERGRITVDDERLYTWVTDPIQTSDRQYIRVFSGRWTAEPGTFRIVGTHLSYQMICTVTVPLP